MLADLVKELVRLGVQPSGVEGEEAVFFFKPEGDIEDFAVIGVEACALPISLLSRNPEGPPQRHGAASICAGSAQITRALKNTRSEERRVGKECRSRWSPYH